MILNYWDTCVLKRICFTFLPFPIASKRVKAIDATHPLKVSLKMYFTAPQLESRFTDERIRLEEGV